MYRKVKILMAMCTVSLICLFYFVHHVHNTDRYWTSSPDVQTYIIQTHRKHSDAVYFTSSWKGAKGIGGKEKKLQRLQDKLGRRSDNNENVDNGKQKDLEKSKNATDGTRYLIFLCNYKEICSGWADRQRAIISVFFLAQVTKRHFGISLTSPCDFKTFYVPNKYNWAVNESVLRHLSTKTPNDRLNNIAYLDFNKAYPQDVIYLRTNKDMFYAIKQNILYSKSVPDWAKFNKPKSFKNGWNLLMKRSKNFDKKFQTILSKIPIRGELICAHLRMRKNPTIPMETKTINSLSSVLGLWKFLEARIAKASRVFIATDSEEVRLWARRYFKDKELDTGLAILHVEKQKQAKNACEGFESVLLDQAILSQCKLLVCSYSNLCKQAVYIGGMRDKVFMFRNGSVYPMKIS